MTEFSLKLLKQSSNKIKGWMTSDQHRSVWKYSIKTAYLRIISQGGNGEKDKVWPRIWNSDLLPKISAFLWLVARNSILTWENLRKREYKGP